VPVLGAVAGSARCTNRFEADLADLFQLQDHRVAENVAIRRRTSRGLDLSDQARYGVDVTATSHAADPKRDHRRQHNPRSWGAGQVQGWPTGGDAPHSWLECPPLCAQIAFEAFRCRSGSSRLRSRACALVMPSMLRGRCLLRLALLASDIVWSTGDATRFLSPSSRNPVACGLGTTDRAISRNARRYCAALIDRSCVSSVPRMPLLTPNVVDAGARLIGRQPKGLWLPRQAEPGRSQHSPIVDRRCNAILPLTDITTSLLPVSQ
jgi:hypothetical protein